MSHESDRERVDQFLADFASGEISAAGARLLGSHLEKDEALRDELRSVLRIDGLLRALASERDSSAADATAVLMRQIEARAADDPRLLSKIEKRIATPVPRMSVAERHRRARARKRRKAAVAVAVAAAAAVLLSAGMRILRPTGGGPSARIMTCTARARVGIGSKSEPARIARWLEPGETIESAHGGAVELRYRDGTELRLAGAASLELVGGTPAKVLALHHGELTASVRPQRAGMPLVARTDRCELTVAGTTFTLTAGPVESLVSVQRGEVAVARLSDGASARVKSGEYLLAGRGSGELAPLPVGTPWEDEGMKQNMARALGGVAVALAAGVAQAQDVSVKVAPVGAVHKMIELEAAPAGAEPNAIRLNVTVANNRNTAVRAPLVVSAEDIFGREVGWRSRTLVSVAPGRSHDEAVEMRTGWGFYTVRASVGEATGVAEVGIIPPHHPGVRKDSFFASNTSDLKRGNELRLIQVIGMKVQRAHFQPRVRGNAHRKPPTGGPLPLDLEGKAREFDDAKAHDTWVLPLTGYAFEGAKSELARRTGMHGPPRDFDEWVKTWELIVRRFPEIETYEFWNEPWIFGWTWAAPPEDYRRLQVMWCRMARRVNPALRVIAGNSSMFVADHIEQYPSSWKGLLDGTTHHPYCYSTSRPTFRAGDSVRSIDDGMDVTRRMGLRRYHLTEGGTWYKEPENSLVNARKIVQCHVQTALTGCFQANAQFNIGWGPQWTRSNQTYAVMTHLLEDRPVVAEVWPENELLWGAVFANPRHVTPEVRALPRAGELASRWKVPIPPERRSDATKVAVLWSFTGESCDRVDTDGTLTIAEARGLTAYDMTGRRIPPDGRRLVLPFTEAPVYVTTETLSVVELRERLANAWIENVTPVNLYALSLEEPGDRPQTLRVRVENQINCTVSGRLRLQIAGEPGETSTSFTIPGGALDEVAIEWPGAKRSSHRQYAVQLAAECRRPAPGGAGRPSVGIGVVSREQLVQTARFVRKTVRIDGALADWEGVTPVVLDSRALRKDLDLTRYLLNPHLARVTGEDEQKRVVAKVYTAYDEGNVYVAAAVNEDAHVCSAGQPVRKGEATLPYRTGMPAGLTHITLCGDVFSFAFGFRDRVPGHGRQMDDPWRWKGFVRDTDYHYVAHTSTDGDMLVRQWGADTDRRNAYQCDDVPHVGPVRGAKVKITRDEARKLTIYEIAIPRGELELFDPAERRCRFAFIVYNDERVGGGSMHWTEAAGVFDHWRGSGSFGPSWNQVLPCQTFFAVEE